jgi:hypothetical protein
MRRRSRERGGKTTEASRPVRLSPYPLTPCRYSPGLPEGSERAGGGGGAGAAEATRPALPLALPHPHVASIKLNPPMSTTRCIVSTADMPTIRHAHVFLPIALPTTFTQLTVVAPPKPRMRILRVATTESGRQCRPSCHHSSPCRARPPHSQQGRG